MHAHTQTTKILEQCIQKIIIILRGECKESSIQSTAEPYETRVLPNPKLHAFTTQQKNKT